MCQVLSQRACKMHFHFPSCKACSGFFDKIWLLMCLLMKLHLGCGKRYIPGWIHVDGLKFDHVDFVSPVDRLPFIPDCSSDLVYASHVLEHFPRAKAPQVLSEWFRVLKVGGIIRLAVPDIKVLCELYLEHQDLSIIKGPLYGGQDHEYNFHYNGFDQQSLTHLLLQTGFTSVRTWNWRKTEHSNVDDFSQAYYPHMDKDSGILVSLNLEAVK